MLLGLKLLIYGIVVITLLTLFVLCAGMLFQTGDYNYIAYMFGTIALIYISNKLAQRFIQAD